MHVRARHRFRFWPGLCSLKDLYSLAEGDTMEWIIAVMLWYLLFCGVLAFIAQENQRSKFVHFCMAFLFTPPLWIFVLIAIGKNTDKK